MIRKNTGLCLCLICYAMDGGKRSESILGGFSVRLSDSLASYHQASAVFKRYCPTTAYYFACMDRRRNDISHHNCVNSESCDAQSSAVGASSGHITAQCKRQSVGIDEVELLRILKNNEFPLVRCGHSTDGSLQLSLNAQAESHISHDSVSCQSRESPCD